MALTPAGKTSGSGGYQGSGVIVDPTAIAIDGSGDVWLANHGNNVVEIIGVGVPVITPIGAGLLLDVYRQRNQQPSAHAPKILLHLGSCRRPSYHRCCTLVEAAEHTGMAHNTASRFSILAGVILISTTVAAAQNPSPGISHELAISRAARVSDLHYDLSFDLKPHAETMPGKETLRFTLTASGHATDLPIDFRDGTISTAKINGQTIPTTLTEGHLLLPAKYLSAGENKFEATFSSRIATAGAAITRYEDKDDGSEYIYSLFVPMDASMAFPCFDQPDLKGRFKLSVDAEGFGTIISNTKPEFLEQESRFQQIRFQETKPISTYLFAFAAGPWVSVHPTPGKPNVYVRKSQVKRAEPEIPQLQEITARGMAWLADYFQQPFPFPEYDIVLIPGFPFGGMEHAGETFLREDVVLFRTAPTAADRFGRNITVLHELTHQWFGDLVTMRWFDDLWLKEGFAQYMAYRCLDSLQPNDGAWKHFYEDIKPQAYGIDETEGTTPIFQNIPNLKDAKSAYGAIVYQKAPAILKQLEFALGSDAFRNGLRIYLKQHAYSNAEWSDLIDAFHTASGKDVRTWADFWVLHRGMPEVSVEWSCDRRQDSPSSRCISRTCFLKVISGLSLRTSCSHTLTATLSPSTSIFLHATRKPK